MTHKDAVYSCYLYHTYVLVFSVFSKILCQGRFHHLFDFLFLIPYRRLMYIHCGYQSVLSEIDIYLYTHNICTDTFSC